MEYLKPSNELAEVLIKEGFIETTEEIYPKHFKYIKENGYDPKKSKRRFHFEGDETLMVIFDYINVQIFVNSWLAGSGIGLRRFTMDDLKRKIVDCKYLDPLFNKN